MVRSCPTLLPPAISGAAPASLSTQFGLIIGGLCAAVAARAPGNLVAAPLLVLLWGRLQRLVVRFARLVEQAAGGTLPVRRPRSAGAAGAAPARAAPAWRRLPAGFGWLVRFVPEAASYGSQLQHLLSQPEMAALIAAAPQVGRMVGPLGWMLAVRTVPGARPRGARPSGARPRVARPVKIRPVPHCPPPIGQPLDPEIPASGFLASGVPYWARNAWPGHDYAGRDPPPRRRQVTVEPRAVTPGRGPPKLDRSG